MSKDTGQPVATACFRVHFLGGHNGLYDPRRFPGLPANKEARTPTRVSTEALACLHRNTKLKPRPYGRVFAQVASVLKTASFQ